MEKVRKHGVGGWAGGWVAGGARDGWVGGWAGSGQAGGRAGVRAGEPQLEDCVRKRTHMSICVDFTLLLQMQDLLTLVCFLLQMHIYLIIEAMD